MVAAAEAGGAADWNDVFRRAHSLKGAARAVDLPAVEEIAHRLEALFEVLHDMTDVDEVVRVSAAHEVDFLPPEANE